MAQPQPVTAGMFADMAELVRAELATADPGLHAGLLARPLQFTRPARRVIPAAFEGPAGRWVYRQTADLREVAAVTGLSYNSLRVYRAQARKARRAGEETFRHMPAETAAGRWQWGALVLWRAVVHPGHVAGAAHGFKGRWPDHASYLPQLQALLDEHGDRIRPTDAAAALGVGRKLAAELLTEVDALPGRVRDDEALPFLAELAARQGRRLTLADVCAELDAAGLPMWEKRARRLYLEAGGRLPEQGRMDGPEPGLMESLRPDGLVTQAQVARAFEVSGATVSIAVKEGRLTQVPTSDDNVCFDPARVTRRADFRAGPVDVGHPLAAPQLSGPAPEREQRNGPDVRKPGSLRRGRHAARRAPQHTARPGVGNVAAVRG